MNCIAVDYFYLRVSLVIKTCHVNNTKEVQLSNINLAILCQNYAMDIKKLSFRTWNYAFHALNIQYKHYTTEFNWIESYLKYKL